MNIEKLVRENILKLKPYTSARQSHSEGILLDANENSFGSVLTDDIYTKINRYPDPYQRQLRDVVGNNLNINPDSLFFGVGSDEVIDLIIRIFCNPGLDNAIVCEPTYGMYRVSCDVNDVKVKNVPLTSEFDIDIDEIRNAVDERSKILFLCSPNNPTANLLSKKKILELVADSNLIVVVDEAYIDFVANEGLINYVEAYNNLVVLRTFSKAWGLAGLRCGYCSASVEIINLLHKIKSPYNISKLTSEAIVKSVDNKATYKQYIKEIVEQREIVNRALKGNKKILNVLPSDSNFISFKVEEPQNVFSYLEKNGIIIRDRSNQYNFDGYLRVTIGTAEENNLFLKKLDEVL